MAERDAGADFAGGWGACGSGMEGLRGRGVPQISHSRSRGLLRNVHAIHATSFDVLLCMEVVGGEGAGELKRLSFPRLSEEERLRDEDGKEVERDCEAKGEGLGGILMGALTEVLGTPHNEQTMDVDDVNPIGFRLLQTSHSQN